MRSAAIAILALLVLGLLAANTRLRSGNAHLEARLAAAEKRSRPKPVLVREAPIVPPPAPAGRPAPPPPAPQESEPVPATPLKSLAIPERSPSPLVSDSTILDNWVTAASEAETFTRRVSLDLTGAFLPRDPFAGLILTESQTAVMESLKQARDAELQPFKDKVREIELRYEEEMQRLLTPEQYRQQAAQKQTLQLGGTVYWYKQDER